MDDAVVCDDGEVLLVARDVGDGEADCGKDLLVAGLQQVADELEAAHEAAHHVAGVLGVADTRRQRPGGCSLASKFLLLSLFLRLRDKKHSMKSIYCHTHYSIASCQREKQNICWSLIIVTEVK